MIRKTFLFSALLCSLGIVAFTGKEKHAHDCGAAESIPEASGKFNDAPPTRMLRFFSQREGDTTRFFAENLELSEMTVTFDVALMNLKGNVEYPYTTTLPSRKVTEVFYVAPVNDVEQWSYSYTNYYKLGSNRAVHDDTAIYVLPYPPGKSYRVTQGYNGKFSHKGSNQYSIDWKMPEGTPVLAARGGVVVKVKNDSDRGGPHMKFDRDNNFVLIQHDDGTMGHYCHLQKGGAQVKAGDRVSAGDWIALSGNTGFSSGPHLHFSVYKNQDGRVRESIPVKFRTESEIAELREGRSYRAL